MPIDDPLGTCDICDRTFSYRLIHNGFNESAYAYCAKCGSTALLSGWADSIPTTAGFRVYERIADSVEPFLTPCPCGGRFTAKASPRCPACRSELSAVKVGEFLEQNVPGGKAGWRWQGNWSGIYAIVIGGRVTSDNWVHHAQPHQAVATNTKPDPS